MMEFRAALFDLDGTLLDSEGIYTDFWKGISAEFCPEVKDLASLVRGISPSVTIPLHFKEESVRNEVFRRMAALEREMPFRMFDGSLEFIRELKSNAVLCALVTSSKIPKMEMIYKKVQGFRDLFDYILTAEEFTQPKPSPDCYLKAASVLGLSPSDCIVFEDSDAGLESGLSAGMFTVGLATSKPKECLASRCNLTVESFKELSFKTLTELLNNR